MFPFAKAFYKDFSSPDRMNLKHWNSFSTAKKNLVLES